MVDNLYSQLQHHPNIGISCLYADYKDQTTQTLVHILGSFLRQFLTTTQEPIPNEIIQKLQDIQRKGGKVGLEDNLALLRIRILQLKCVFICIDALDELESKVLRQLLNTLKELGSNNIRLFITGRSHVESEVQKYFQATQIYTVAICANEEDIKTFVNTQIIDDPYPDAMDEALEKDLISTIIKKSQGM